MDYGITIAERTRDLVSGERQDDGSMDRMTRLCRRGANARQCTFTFLCFHEEALEDIESEEFGDLWGGGVAFLAWK